MYYFRVFLLILLISATSFSQLPFNNFQFRGKFDFENPSETILSYDLFEQGKKLRLIGNNTIQLWDVESKKVLSSRKHEIEDLSEATFGGVSPDKNKLFVLGYETKAKEKDAPKIKTPAKIYDLESGKLLKVLDKSDRLIKSAVWSRNGKILVTADNDLLSRKEYFAHKDETEISFWDGETLEFRSSTIIKDLTWFYISEDGNDFFTTSVPEKKGWFGIPFVNGMTNVINIWDTQTAKNDKNLSIGDENFHTQTYKLMPSPNGKYFAIVSKNKETDDEHRVILWQIGNGAMPKYTIKANPKIRDSLIAYSPDSKYFALDSGKDVQIYDIESGKMTKEVKGYNLPHYWLNDNQTFVYDKIDSLKAVNIADSAVVYQNPLVYITETTENYKGTKDVFGNEEKESITTTIDSTTVVPSPNRKMFLTYSNSAVDVFNGENGTNLQSIIKSPPIKKKKAKVLGITIFKFNEYPPTTVKSVEWSDDSRMIIVKDISRSFLSIWEIKE